MEKERVGPSAFGQQEFHSEGHARRVLAFTEHKSDPAKMARAQRARDYLARLDKAKEREDWSSAHPRCCE